MTNREVAKLVYQDIIFAIQEAQEKFECQFFMPSYIRIENEAYFYDDLFKDEIKAGFGGLENLK